MTSAIIHPTAIVEAQVTIGKGVKIGPYCVVSGPVVLEEEVELISHVSLVGDTVVGQGTVCYPFCSLGHRPQDLKFNNEKSSLRIGAFNTIREYVTIQPGTEGGGLLTRIGDHCLVMVNAHIAHDCQVGNHVILANNATLAGHVSVGDHTIVGGLSAIHQFVRVGHHAIIGGMSGVEHDVIPYGSVKGERACLYGINLIGLKRRGVGREEMDHLRQAYKTLFTSRKTLAERVLEVNHTFHQTPRVLEITEFIQSDSTRSLCMPKKSQNF